LTLALLAGLGGACRDAAPAQHTPPPLLQRASTGAAVPLLAFSEEEVELTLHPRGLSGGPAAPTLEVRARYVFGNAGSAAWQGPIIYPIYVTPTQPAPSTIELADGSRRAVSCRRVPPERCAAVVELRVAPRSRRELSLRYLQRMPSPHGPAVYMLTSGASWGAPIGRAQLRVLAPMGSTLAGSYPLATLGRLRRGGQVFSVHGYQQEHFVPVEELRVGLRGDLRPVFGGSRKSVVRSRAP
jgi:hypothetical protein